MRPPHCFLPFPDTPPSYVQPLLGHLGQLWVSPPNPATFLRLPFSPTDPRPCRRWVPPLPRLPHTLPTRVPAGSRPHEDRHSQMPSPALNCIRPAVGSLQAAPTLAPVFVAGSSFPTSFLHVGSPQAPSALLSFLCTPFTIPGILHVQIRPSCIFTPTSPPHFSHRSPPQRPTTTSKSVCPE